MKKVYNLVIIKLKSFKGDKIMIKQRLLNQLKEINSLPFLFIGSGISKRYLGLENWEELLKKFAKEATGNEFQYQLYLNEVVDNEKFGKLPKVAELLEKDFIKKYFSDSSYTVNREKNKILINNNVSPFKIILSEYFKGKKYDSLNEEVKLLKNIAYKNIGGVITTNYDDFLEEIFEGYKVYIGQEELLFSNIYEIGEIYKIHGCCSVPESIVITEKDYNNFINKNDYLTAKLLTIFLEHPIIFLGYSISDKNIENILKSIANCLSQEKLDVLKKRLIFVEWTDDVKINEITTHSIQFENKNKIEMTKITLNDFSEIYKALLLNKAKYNPKILRELKQNIYELVQTNNPSEKIKVVGLEETDKLKEIEIVIGIGVINNFGKQGYYGISAVELYKDVVFNDKGYDNQEIVDKTLLGLLKSNSNGLPIHKYWVKNSNINSQKLIELKNKKFDDFLNNSIRNKSEKKRLEILDKSIDGIIKIYGIEEAIKWISYLKEDEINVMELENYLKEILKNNPKVLEEGTYKSEIKRLIRVYDYLKYSK